MRKKTQTAKTPPAAADVQKEQPLAQAEEAGGKPEAEQEPGAEPVCGQEPDEEPAPPPQPGEEPDPSAEQDALAALQADCDALRKELCEARARLAAYAAGIDATMVGDAVTLATAQAGPEADEAVLAEALQTVLRRHPEWRASSGRSGGFVLGAAPQPAQRREPTGEPAHYPWNRYREARL